jgi:hypothetical protein
MLRIGIALTTIALFAAAAGYGAEEPVIVSFPAVFIDPIA